MATYVVKSAVQKSTKTTDYGEMQSIQLVLNEYGQAEDIGAEWYTKAATPLPQPGSRLEGEISPSQYGPKFKKTQATGGRGGGRSPEQERSITRMHSQHMALLYVQAKAALGQLPESFKPNDMSPIIDWFDRDALEGWKP